VSQSTPDAIEPVVGWRCWLVDPDRLRLRSPQRLHHWLPGRPLEVAGHCGGSRFAGLAGIDVDVLSELPVTCPCEARNCGIHAAHTPEHALANRGWPYFVLGKVELYGKVINGTLGARGQKARIAGLGVTAHELSGHVSPEIVDELCGIYDVPLIVLPPLVAPDPQVIVHTVVANSAALARAFEELGRTIKQMQQVHSARLAADARAISRVLERQENLRAARERRRRWEWRLRRR
jgi:hypothetical protein